MHVGVLIPVKHNSIKERMGVNYIPDNALAYARKIAEEIIMNDDFCWKEVDYPYDPEDEEFNQRDFDAADSLNEYAAWDYPYGIKPRWYDGVNEDTTINSGISVKELKDNYITPGIIGADQLAEMFTFIYLPEDMWVETWNGQALLEYIMELPDDCLIFVGCVHI